MDYNDVDQTMSLPLEEERSICCHCRNCSYQGFVDWIAIFGRFDIHVWWSFQRKRFYMSCNVLDRCEFCFHFAFWFGSLKGELQSFQGKFADICFFCLFLIILPCQNSSCCYTLPWHDVHPTIHAKKTNSFGALANDCAENSMALASFHPFHRLPCSDSFLQFVFSCAFHGMAVYCNCFFCTCLADWRALRPEPIWHPSSCEQHFTFLGFHSVANFQKGIGKVCVHSKQSFQQTCKTNYICNLRELHTWGQSTITLWIQNLAVAYFTHEQDGLQNLMQDSTVRSLRRCQNHATWIWMPSVVKCQVELTILVMKIGIHILAHFIPNACNMTIPSCWCIHILVSWLWSVSSAHPFEIGYDSILFVQLSPRCWHHTGGNCIPCRSEAGYVCHDSCLQSVRALVLWFCCLCSFVWGVCFVFFGSAIWRLNPFAQVSC